MGRKMKKKVNKRKVGKKKYVENMGVSSFIAFCLFSMGGGMLCCTLS